MWTRMRLWLVSLLRHRRFDADLADELAFHLRAREEYWEERGRSRDEAHRLARLEFGSPDKVRAEVTDVRRGAWVEQLARDVRYGVRSLRRHPGFTAMAVASLAIGIGANAAIFGVARTVVFREVPYAQPDTLVNIYETERGEGFNPPSHPNIEDLRAATSHVFAGIAASTFVPAPMERGGTVTTIIGEAVTGGAFGLLGVEPHLGRAILAEDDVGRGAHPVVMLSYGYWQRAFAGDPHIVGRTLRMGGRQYTIVGVAPADYRGGLPAITPAFFVPMSMLDELGGVAVLDQRDFHSFFVTARLAPGVTRSEAEHAASLVAAALSQNRPEGWIPGERFVLVPSADVRIHPGLDSIFNAAAWLLMGVVGLVLLLSCANLASFLLARALDRTHESAVRRALGATRSTLAHQALVESTLLGLAGAAAGFVLAVALVGALVRVDLPLPYGFRLDLHLGLDWRAMLDWKVLAFTTAAGLLAGTALGLLPAVQGTRADPGASLSAAGRGEVPGPRRWRSTLLVAQVAMSFVLLVGAGLFLRSWQETLAADPGFGRASTAVVSIMVARATAEESEQLTERLLDAFRAQPGVEAAGLIWPLPLELSSSFTEFTIDGRAPPAGREAFRAEQATIDGGFFEAAGIAIVAGRTFDDDDRRDGRPVAVVSRAMARRYWPDGNALGQILRRPDPGEDDLVIVGVADDINVRSLGEVPRDVVYKPYTQSDPVLFYFLARTPGDPAALSAALANVGREVDPDLQVMQSTTMAQHLALSRMPSQMGAFVLTAFAVVGIALVLIGVYGAVRHIVAVRIREVGIRMALGADAAGVTRLMARHGVRLVLVGGGIGLAASALASRFVAPMLFRVGAFDLVALTGATVVLGLTAWLAAWLPARRASRIDPLAALRTE